MIALMRTIDAVKFSAVEALLRDAGVETLVFDGAAGSLWRSIIPVRLMVGDDDLARARRVLHDAGFREAGDGDWDLVGNRA
ncbi:MAG: DUF2007 domain-containing protein [Caulobacteraceae bacterium]|nr:DUF2007 domain-containing protein [Caulobacteraceae bacterium]